MATTTPNYEVDFEDERLQAVDDKYAGLKSESHETYQDMIDQSDGFYNAQIEASKNWAEEQKQLQNEQTDFTIEQIEQQKEQAHKDYIKEQSGAYKDWQKQSDKYGVNAEQMAASGMAKTGFSESSQVAMYNQYQNRVATAREVFNRSLLAYDNSIKEARLQNSSILAEIAYKALVEQNELALAGFQYKNGLILERTNKMLELESMRNQEWYQVLAQINSENAMKEEARQIEAAQAFQKEMAEIEQANKLAYLDAQMKADKELWDYKNSDTGGSAIIDKQSNSAAASENTTDDSSEEYPVNTEYYRGNKNPDAEKYGTFNDGDKIGYQPKGISGHGKLKATGDTITFKTTTLDGKEKTVTQKVWEAEDGTKWYWDGRYNKYLEFKENNDSSTDEPSGDARTNPLIAGLPPRSEVQAVGKFTDGPAVSTEYYYGDLNPDAKIYGTFENGYQPKGISGHGKLTKQGTTFNFETTTLSGEKKTVTQNIWIAEDGTCWYWDGRKNKYIFIQTHS